MEIRGKTTPAHGELHWLQVGKELLNTLRSRGDSGDEPEISFLEESAAEYGKSSHTIRKIIDATIWVDAFFPHLLEEPPARFPMTNALQLRAIHRIDPNRAEAISHDVFEGIVSRRHLAEIVSELRGVYRPKAKRTEDASGSESKLRDAQAFEDQVEKSLKLLLEAEGFSSKPVICSGRRVLPRCDFLIQQDGEPTIAVEAKGLSPTVTKEKILHLLGNFALWQSQGLNTWLFVPSDTSSRIEKLQAMAAQCRLDPVTVFVVHDESVFPWKPEAESE